MEGSIVYFKVFMVLINITKHINAYIELATILKASIPFMHNGKTNKNMETRKRIYAPHFFHEYTAIIAIIFIVEVSEYIIPSPLVKIPTVSNFIAK